MFDGSSLILDERGNVVAEGAAFAEDLVVADVDLDEVFNARLHDTRLRKERAGEVSDQSLAAAGWRLLLCHSSTNTIKCEFCTNGRKNPSG